MQQQRMGAVGIGLDARIGQAVAIIIADLDEGLGDDIGLDALGRGIGMLVGDFGEIAEGLGRVLGDALAVFIHGAELPHGHGLAGFGCVFERGEQVVARHAAACPVEHIGHFKRGIGRGLRLGRHGCDR